MDLRFLRLRRWLLKQQPNKTVFNRFIENQYQDGSRISIDCTAVENEAAGNCFRRLEPDCLICNDPPAYADLVLNGDVAVYLNAVTGYRPCALSILRPVSARMLLCFAT